MAEATRRERRRLAAILAADVVGYAQLLAADEARTLARLRGLFRELVQPLVAAHGGRIFRLLGDAVLAEFPSAVGAMRCALAWQEAMAQVEEEPRILLRIGIALGDVVVEGGDLYGDAVNIAARLEALAEPGGILVAETVAGQVRGRLDCGLEDAGLLALKNLPERVHAFRVAPRIVVPSTGLLPDRPSLVVLPFINLGGNPADDYLADGITEELTTALSRVRWFFVIARTSAFTYKGRAVDVRRIGQELGVRYALEGSLRRVSERLRVTCQLIETETGRHVWAERFDGSVDDIFALEDCVAMCAAGAIGPCLQQAEIDRLRRKPDALLDAYELYLRALPHLRRITPEDNEVALGLLRRAITIDPGFALPTALAGFCLMMRIVEAGRALPGAAEEAVRLARLALVLDPEDAETTAWAADVIGYVGQDRRTALDLVQKALALNPNSAVVRMVAGWVHCWLCRPVEAIQHFDMAVCISPRDPEMPRVHSGYALCHLMARRYAEAAEAARHALALKPGWINARRSLICALALAGEKAEALALAEALRRDAPAAARVDQARFARYFADPEFVARRCEAFRSLGFPE